MFLIPELKLQYGLAGSLLLELSMDGSIKIVDNKLHPVSDKRERDPLLADLKSQIHASSKPRKIRYWINKAARNYNRKKKQIILDLEQKGLIKVEHHKFLGIIPYRKNFLRDQKIRNELIRRLKSALSIKEEMTEELVILCGLIQASKMHMIFSPDKSQQKKIEKQLKEIIKDSPIAGTIDKTIQEVQAAILTTIIASSVATSASSH